MKITVVAPSLLGGGAERAIVLLTEGFLLQGHQVTVVTLYGQDTDSYKLPAGAARLALDIAADSRNLIHGGYQNLRRLRVLRNAIRGTRPDVVISHTCQTNVVTAMALAGAGLPLVVVEHSAPATNARGRVWDKLRRITYPHVARVVSVSEGINGYFRWLPTEKRAVINNPVKFHRSSSSVGARAPRRQGERSANTTPQLSASAESEVVYHSGSKQHLVAMGRLIQVKGFDRLLSAFKQLADTHPDWELVILGEGELRPELERQRTQLGLADRVHLPGFSDNPFLILRAAKLFVMTSHSEGFPYALLEAMSCGLPAVAMDCESGPREIIRPGVDGLLVADGDVDSLAAALDRLMTNEPERQTLAARAAEVLDRFGLEKIITQWEKLFAEVVSRDGR